MTDRLFMGLPATLQDLPLGKLRGLLARYARWLVPGAFFLRGGPLALGRRNATGMEGEQKVFVVLVHPARSPNP